MGGYDLMWNDGPVYREDVTLETLHSSCFTANTHLGNLFFEGTFFGPFDRCVKAYNADYII